MLKSILGNFSVRFSSAVFNLLIAILVSQFLGAGGKGEQSLILAAITITLLIHNVISGASIIYLASRLNTRKIMIVSYSWTFLVGLITYLGLLKLAYFDFNISLAIALLSILNSFISINSSLLIGNEKIMKSNVLNFLVPFLTLVFLFVQFYFYDSRDVSAYISALFFSYTLVFVFSIYYVKANFFEIDSINSKLITTFKSLFTFGFQNQLAHVFQLFSFRISYFVIESFKGKDAVGIYSNGISIAEAIWMITSSICLYQYSKISNSDDKVFQLALTEKLIKMSLFISFIAIFIVSAVPTSFYTWLFGEEFMELKSIIVILLPGIFVYNYYLIISHYFSGKGKFLFNAIATFMGLLVTLILIFFLIPKFGIKGAALTAIIYYFITSIVILVFYIRQGGKFVFFPHYSEISNYMFSNKV